MAFLRDWLLAGLIAVVLFGGGSALYVYSAGTTVTVTVAESLSFSLSSNNFPSLTPGTPVYATTTLNVTTNNTAGWNTTLLGDDQTDSDTVCDLDTDATVGITDDTEWIPGAATTTAGNATTVTSGDDILAFRVMSASGSVPFRAGTWWGATDGYPGTSLWAGIASTTASDKKIGNAGAGSYSASAHLNTVVYYLDVPATQQTGAYSCPLTFSVTGN